VYHLFLTIGNAEYHNKKDLEKEKWITMQQVEEIIQGVCVKHDNVLFGNKLSKEIGGVRGKLQYIFLASDQPSSVVYLVEPHSRVRKGGM
jgi:hypothetical protein